MNALASLVATLVAAAFWLAVVAGGVAIYLVRALIHIAPALTALACIKFLLS